MILSTYFHYFFNKCVDLHLIKLVEIGPVALEKKTFKHGKFYVFSLLCYSLPLEKGMALHLKQEAHGPHRSPEKTVQINKHI